MHNVVYWTPWRCFLISSAICLIIIAAALAVEPLASLIERTFL